MLHPRFHLGALPARRRRLHALFRVVCIVTTPFFVGLPGFRSKLWMVDPATGGGSVTYELVTASTVRAYLEAAAGGDGGVGRLAGGHAGAAGEPHEAGDPAGVGG